MESEEGAILSPAPLSEEIEDSEPDPIVPEIPPGFDSVNPSAKKESTKSEPSSSSEPINAMPISYAFPAAQNYTQGGKCKLENVSDRRPPSKKAKLTVRSLSRELVSLASSSSAATDQPRANVDAILSTFDALRRNLERISEAKGVKKRSDMRAEMIMNANGLMANRQKRVGSVPGVEIGDIFYFRMEMCVIGLHSLPMAGIDHMKHGTNSIAVAVVASGGYENDDNNVNEMVYTGQGGNGKNVEKRCDQKLQGVNYALEQSSIWKNPIRVVRSRNDPFARGNKIYIYDGLYKIQNLWTERPKSGLLTFKHRLVREMGQPDGFAVWKMTEDWKREPSSRGSVLITSDLSLGVEHIPVVVVNEIDDDPEPDNFMYITTITRVLNEKIKKEKGMIPTECKCESYNNGSLAYSSGGLLIQRLPILYECGPGCECTVNCRNKVTQKGVRLHFEVFRTEDRGWGLRSWDPIRAGSFVCEFLGKNLDKKNDANNKELFSNEYVFRPTDPGRKALNWNRGMELAEEEPDITLNKKHYGHEPIIPVPVINAKETGNVSRFINHSCDPNLFWQLVRHGGHGDDLPINVVFFAMKHVPPMTELTYDYNGDVEGNGGRGVETNKCLCGAPNCRGYF